MDDRSTNTLIHRMERLARENRRWRLAAAAAAVVAAGWLVAGSPLRTAQGRQDPPSPATATDAQAIVTARLDVARKALAIIRRKTALGPQVSHPVNDTYHWSVIQLGTQIYLSMGNDEIKVEAPEVYLAVAHARPSRDRLAAFEAHFKLMQYWEDRLRPLAEKTILAPLDFLQIQEHRLQAELWLARERGKNAAN